MPSIDYGYKRAIAEIVSGIGTAAIIDVLVTSKFISPSLMLIFNLANGLGVLVLWHALPYWGTTYAIGWLIGMWIMLQSGLLSWLDIVAFFVVPFIYLILKLSNSIENYDGSL